MTWSFSQRPSIPARVLQAITKERVPFLITLTLLLGVGTVLTRLPERIYESKSTLLIQAPATSTRLISPGEQPAVVGELNAVGDRVSPVNNQVALLKSRPIYDLALERLNLTTSDAPYGNLQVKGVEGTDLVEVSYQSNSPELAADVVQTVVEVYMEQNLSSNRAQGSQARQFIQSQLDSLQNELAQARDRLENFQTSSGFLGTTVETDAITESLSEFASQVAAARAELSATEQRIAQMRTQLSGDPLATLNAAGVSQDPAYQELQSQLVEAQGQLADYENRFTENDPYVTSARERRDRIQALMNQRSEQLLGQQSPQQPVDPIRQRLVEQWFTLQAERSAQAARLAQLTQQYNQLQARSRQLPELIKQQSQLQLDAELAEQEYRTFEQQYTATRIAEQQEVSNVRVVEPATVNDNPIAPNDKLLLALVVVVSTALALALVWLLRSRSNSLEETKDLKEILPLPILATVPRRSNGRLSHEESLDRQPLSHSYQLLQAHMRMLPQQVRAIAICSWAPQEGRSSVAHNLALVEAKSGQRVLLIDAHRRPNPTYVRSLAATDGTNGSPSWHSTVQKVLPGFDVLPQVAASLTTNYRDWLVLLDQARERYDLVILDCPPACQSADAALLASLADGVLWVVYPDLLGRQGVEAAAETLQTWSTRLLGQVVIGVEESLPARSDSSRYLVGSEV
jgi:polysaccharide biosynthesis transport protein